MEGESGIPALVRKLFHSSLFLNRSAMFEFKEVRDTEQTNVSVLWLRLLSQQSTRDIKKLLILKELLILKLVFLFCSGILFRYQKTRENVDWQAYKSTKKLYNQTIHKSKMDCFKNYCEDQRSPWNIIDNILTRDNKNKQIPLLKDPDSDPPEYTTSSFQTAKLIAKHMFPDDIIERQIMHTINALEKR